MKKSEKEEMQQLFRKIIPIFFSRCFACHEPYNTTEAWTVHHRVYKPEEKIYSDFKLPNGKPDKLSYYRYLVPIILSLPRAEARKRFHLLHHKHHWLAESWARLKPANFERMVKLAREINKTRFKRIR